jgi:hypothetical protein
MLGDNFDREHYIILLDDNVDIAIWLGHYIVLYSLCYSGIICVDDNNALNLWVIKCMDDNILFNIRCYLLLDDNIDVII